ncbi:hypothetical protein B0H16DRAFT_1493232 [Mycena metata]|uniref:Uncharacterized protein n=1 Tax=Mycena metata TaxID=1033252 RepID=A0AAD7KFP8_9AGAR|nr:hypothetical protein B0H16DRAFT_1493232 [Mycena metata]
MLSYKTVLLALLFSSSSLALPIRREVPQEHSHQAILTSVQTSLSKNNPDGIVDAVFGLLGNAAAAGGLGKITDANCLQQATADQAFSNAKAAGDIQGMSDALTYRALERNSGTVGGTTTPCTTIKAVNPEIAAIQQHQDPASTNAAAVNKGIVLELAKQIASIGGNPQDALRSGTFAPGKIGDTTGKGNTCDVATDAAGCIVSQKLLVEDATADEITAAVAGVSASSGSASSGSGSAADTTAAAATAPAATTAAAPPAVVATSSSIGNFGSCTVPQIEFATGFDNRKETSFQPVDKTSYNHGSAQAISIITQFICDTLTNTCGADATAKATCATAQAAANAAPPKTGIDADIFNGAFGITTNFRNVEAVDDQGNPIAGSTGGSVSVAVTGAAETGAAAATYRCCRHHCRRHHGRCCNDCCLPRPLLRATSRPSPGALGGLPPPVTAGGAKGFVVNGSEFIQEAGALGRSCDEQHNACANAANASGASFTVADCDTQNNACHAAITA